MILLAMSEYQNVERTYWILRILGFCMMILGFVLMYFFNKKAINMFNPSFYQKFEEEMQKKKRQKEMRKEEKRKRKEGNF
jgi:Na+-driven multidrug efflux pump